MWRNGPWGRPNSLLWLQECPHYKFLRSRPTRYTWHRRMFRRWESAVRQTSSSLKLTTWALSKPASWPAKQLISPQTKWATSMLPSRALLQRLLRKWVTSTSWEMRASKKKPTSCLQWHVPTAIDFILDYEFVNRNLLINWFVFESRIWGSSKKEAWRRRICGWWDHADWVPRGLSTSQKFQGTSISEPHA